MLTDLDAALEYIGSHREITNVLLTGGDPLMLSSEKLRTIIRGLAGIEHIRIVRIGSKVPAFNPYRILDDPSLADVISDFATGRRSIYVMTHFNHPRELSDAAVEGLHRLRRSGAILCDQTPLIRGVNDDPNTLAELLRQLSFIGVPPYYVFQCRPAVANKAYAVPVEEGYRTFELAKSAVSGLAKRARYVMSHTSGKIQVVGMAEDRIYFKYHRAANDADSGRFLVFRRNPDAFWFDDYAEVLRDYPVMRPYRSEGPE